MGKQIGFSEFEYGQKRKKTQKEVFFEKMKELVPLKRWCEIIRPYYYENGNGRQPIELETMLRMYLVSQWYNLSDSATEDILTENMAVRKYVGIEGDAPDETTLCKFRHLLERNELCELIFGETSKALIEKKVILKEGTIVDATIIEAPKSKKNKDRARDSEMSSVMKNKQHYFGMKLHIGVDKETGLVHSAAVTTASVSDVGCAHEVLHGGEKTVNGDAGYIGIDKRPEVCKKYADGSGRTEKQKPSHGKKRPDTLVKRKDIAFVINKKRGAIVTDDEKEEERQKSRIRAKVEHIFGIIKHIFKFRKVRYKTLAKNGSKLLMLCALANVYRCLQMKLSAI